MVSFDIRNIMIDSYINMLGSGVKFNISRLSEDYLRDLIKKGPFLSIVSYNYIYDAPRDKYNAETKKYEEKTFTWQNISCHLCRYIFYKPLFYVVQLFFIGFYVNLSL